MSFRFCSVCKYLLGSLQPFNIGANLITSKSGRFLIECTSCHPLQDTADKLTSAHKLDGSVISWMHTAAVAAASLFDLMWNSGVTELQHRTWFLDTSYNKGYSACLWLTFHVLSFSALMLPSLSLIRWSY